PHLAPGDPSLEPADSAGGEEAHMPAPGAGPPGDLAVGEAEGDLDGADQRLPDNGLGGAAPVVPVSRDGVVGAGVRFDPEPVAVDVIGQPRRVPVGAVGDGDWGVA